MRIDNRALAAAGIPAQQVVGSLQAANAAAPGGTVVDGNQATLIRTNSFLRTSEDVESVVVGVTDGRPVRLGSVASIVEVAQTESYVAMIGGAAEHEHGSGQRAGGSAPAVTLSIAKRKGANAQRKLIQF